MEEKEPILVDREKPGDSHLNSYLKVSALLFLASLLLLFAPRLHSPDHDHDPCNATCTVELVESIPEGLIFNSSLVHTSTHAAWTRLIELSRDKIHLAGMYWSLRGQDVYSDPSDWAGEDIFHKLMKVGRDEKVKLRIAQNAAKPGTQEDTERLAEVGAEVRNVNFTSLVGTGILHTKLWVVDDKHFYVGSANFDWRSLTQVKEVGVLVTDCPCLAMDMEKIWSVYWEMGVSSSLPPSWPDQYSTQYNAESPLQLPSLPQVYLSSSPAPLCPSGREIDVDAIIKTIDAAEKFVEVAVMDYFPATLYTPHTHFWPDIDDALRRAAIDRGVRVRLLISHWDHTRPSMMRYLRSLAVLSGSHPSVDIQVRMFTVPAFTPEQKKIPFARVNHNKYMVTDKQGYIGTSNWSGDYFLSTGGVGFVFTGQLRKQLAAIFQRDWESSYSQALEEMVEQKEGKGSHLLYNHFEL